MKSHSLCSNPFLLSIAALLSFLHSFAQDRHLDSLYSYQPALTSSNDVVNLTGEGSFIHNNNKTGITEEVLLYPYWQKGVVNFNNGMQTADIDLKFNLVRNELYFNNGGKANYFVDTVTSFTIFDTANHILKTANFSNGYPAFGRQTDKTFYLVLTSGPAAHLLKYISKRQQEIYQYSAPATTQYSITEELLVYNVKEDALKPVKKNMASIEKALPEYTKILKATWKSKTNKNLTDEEVMKAIMAVNAK